MIYNIVSGVQQSDSAIYTYTHISMYIYTHICTPYMYLFFFRFFSIRGYYKTLNIAPCAIEQVSVVYLFYT